jgi:magnesium transporter
MRTRLYRNGVVVKQGFPIDDVSDYVCDDDCVVWFDLCAPAPAELGKIGEELGLHELAVEDVLMDHQRPKLDVYDSHLFISVYGVHVDEEGALQPVEIDVFATRNALVTVRQDDRFDIDAVVARWDAGGGLAKNGVSFLLHGLLDYVVDGHFDLVQSLDGQVEDLEDALFGDSGNHRELQRRTFALRKNMVRFRKMAMPMREVVTALYRRDVHVVTAEMAPYYQDVHDHVLRVADWVDSLRELVSNLRETHLAQQGFRLNEIMKRLTGWAAIIAVPTAITGFYGQNVPYPGEGQPWGFWVSSLVVATASIALYTVFKKKDWL